MFILGHIGVGSRLGRLVPAARAPEVTPWLVLGTILPDLLDKPLYYALALASGGDAARMGLITCTRTVGHSALFALLLWLAFAAAGRRAAGLALFIGMATHWLLDLGGDTTGFVLARLGLIAKAPGFSSLRALLFPVVGRHFGRMPYHTPGEHLRGLAQAYTIAGELIGGALLFGQWRARRRLAEPPPFVDRDARA